MFDFMRNKIIGVEQKDGETLIARGALDDDMYGMRLKVTVRLPDLVITSIQGRLDRYTTPECPQADVFLQEVVGLSVRAGDFGRRVHKTVWRRSCQHYASLLVDCGTALCQAAGLLGHETGEADQASQADEKTAGKEDKGSKSGKSPFKSEETGPDRNKGDGFVIDLHVHTAEASSCSSAPVEELIQEAVRIGLDGLCLTDHNHLWEPQEAAELSRRHGLVVLRGNEITTDQGDMLVFGLDKDIKGITPLAELRREVLAADGFMIAAHPFRGFLTFGVDRLGLTVDKAGERELFTLVDGIEIRNGRVTAEENRFAEEVAEALGLPAVAGSDAHQVAEVGRFATRFEESVRDEQGLIEALRRGRFQAVSFRKEIKEG